MKKGVPEDDGLTPREREVARCAGGGMRNREIATQLGISPATVDVHLNHIFQKLGISRRGELAAYAVRAGSA
jgi:DNA-binding CsgD family transcriptional regulator